jgi:hypothetical protein
LFAATPPQLPTIAMSSAEQAGLTLVTHRCELPSICACLPRPVVDRNALWFAVARRLLMCRKAPLQLFGTGHNFAPFKDWYRR